MGWHSNPHAGEEDGPQSIWQAIRDLGAERVGHGVSAVQDPSLMDYMLEHAVGIESNLTSMYRRVPYPIMQLTH
jgi:adenosine deaminase